MSLVGGQCRLCAQLFRLVTVFSTEHPLDTSVYTMKLTGLLIVRQVPGGGWKLECWQVPSDLDSPKAAWWVKNKNHENQHHTEFVLSGHGVLSLNGRFLFSPKVYSFLQFISLLP